MKTEIKRFKPTTPGNRQKKVIRTQDLYKGRSEKSLTWGKKSSSGRNNLGRITVYHRGGGHKRKYREIDNKRTIGKYSTAEVIRIEYDPNRSANIALCENVMKKRFYMVAPKGLTKGKIIKGIFNPTREITSGETRKLSEIPLGIAKKF